jgi:hypothetical protein
MNIIKKNFDQATKERLKGLFPITKTRTEIVTPDFYKDKDDDGCYLIQEDIWPKFTIASLSGTKRLEANRITGDTPIVNTLKYGLVSWDNWFDENGNAIEFKPDYRKNGVVSADALDIIPEDISIWIVVQIKKLNTLSEDDKLGL